jgi:hypothetical protein
MLAEIGFDVWSIIPHSGYRNKVYWAKTAQEATDHAEAIHAIRGDLYQIVVTDTKGVLHDYPLRG